MQQVQHTEDFLLALRTSVCRGVSSPRLIKMGLIIDSVYVTLEEGTMVLGLFSYFRETLQVIVIGVSGEFENTDREHFLARVDLNCPVLRTVHISGISRLSLNFLQNFKETLEEFQFEMRSEDKPREAAYPEETIDLYRHIETGSIYLSNIWEVLPRLRFIDCDFEHPIKDYYLEYCFQRKEFEAIRSQRN